MTTAAKVKHTPGPWQCTENSFGCTALIVQSPDRTLAVSSLRRSAMDDEYLANARLIAAAPEMLEALETIKVRCGASGNNRHDRLVWTIADAAIRKARGEQ